MKAIIAILTFVTCFWIFSEDDCSLYLPDLYTASELDTLFIDSFLFVNTHECDSAQVSGAIDWIEDQWPAFIVGVDVNNDRIFEWSETLDASIIFCENKASMLRTDLFKTRLARLNFDTSHIPQLTYINFINGDFDHIPVVPCDDLQMFGCQNKIVIMGDMGSSYMKPMYGNSPSLLAIPEINGSDRIFKTQLMALTLHSIIRKDMISEAPLSLKLFCYSVICLLTFWMTSAIFNKINTFWLRYILVKGMQALVFIIIFLLVFIVAPSLRYVLNSDAFMLVLIIGVEIIFWVFFSFARWQRNIPKPF